MSRPITAGGFVDDAPIVFIDVTKQAGLDKFRHRSGTPEKATTSLSAAIRKAYPY